MSKAHKLLLVTAIVAVIGVGSLLAVSITHKNPPAVQVDNTPTVEQLWADTNAYRQGAGLAPLVLDPRLVASATAKCVDMVQNKYWAHVSPSGKTPQDFMQQVIPEPITHYYSGENLSIDYNTSLDVTNAWIASPEHQVNLVNTHYVDVGYAVCTNAQSQIMVVQEFLSDPQ